MEKNARTTKKQRELLAFIDAFIKGNNYGPSYREIMRALGYRSVSTVAVHVDGLIAKGHLRKRDNSARSIEVVTSAAQAEKRNIHEEWLLEKMTKSLEKDAKNIEIFLRTLEVLEVDATRLKHPRNEESA